MKFFWRKTYKGFAFSFQDKIYEQAVDKLLIWVKCHKSAVGLIGQKLQKIIQKFFSDSGLVIRSCGFYAFFGE